MLQQQPHLSVAAAAAGSSPEPSAQQIPGNKKKKPCSWFSPCDQLAEAPKLKGLWYEAVEEPLKLELAGVLCARHKKHVERAIKKAAAAAAALGYGWGAFSLQVGRGTCQQPRH